MSENGTHWNYYNVPSWGPETVQKWLGKPLVPVNSPFPVLVPQKLCMNKASVNLSEERWCRLDKNLECDNRRHQIVKKECWLFLITSWLWAINWGTFCPLIKQQSCCWNDFFTCISTLKHVETNIDQFKWYSSMAIYCEINTGVIFERRKPSCYMFFIFSRALNWKKPRSREISQYLRT